MSAQKPVAIVTGASRGLGKAIALGLAKAGYQLAILARSAEALQAVAKEISAINQVNTWTLPVDVTAEQQVLQSIQSVLAEAGRVDVLVNNAGVVIPGDSDSSTQDVATQVQVNLMGAFYCAHAVMPLMKQQQSGYIFNVASTTAKFAKSSRVGYGASKYGMLGMSEGLYHDLAKHNVKVTALCPRYMPTEMTVNADIANKDKIPLEDMVNTILFCLSLSPSVSLKDITLDNTVVAAQH